MAPVSPEASSYHPVGRMLWQDAQGEINNAERKDQSQIPATLMT